MGRLLVRGRVGHDIVPELAPIEGEVVLDKPGKGSFYATDLETILRARGITHLIVTGVTTEVCVQTHRARGQRPGLRLPRAGGLHRLVLPRVPRVALDMFKAQGGIVGWVGDSAAFLDGLGAADPDAVAAARSCQRRMTMARRREAGEEAAARRGRA